MIRWEELPAAEPHAGVRARRFDTQHATVVRYEFDPGARYPLHDHPEEQLVQIVSGQVDLRLGTSTLELGAGDLVHVPGGITHGVHCRGPEPAVFLNIVMPRRTLAAS
jgi:quercetin dioxygenase-like cupin family protein